MEFWFNKAIAKIRGGQKEIALHCFKQALIQDPLNFASIFNLGALYEKLGKFQVAKKWFLL